MSDESGGFPPATRLVDRPGEDKIQMTPTRTPASAALAIVTVSAMALAACSDGDTSDSSTDTATATTVAVKETTAQVDDAEQSDTTTEPVETEPDAAEPASTDAVVDETEPVDSEAEAVEVETGGDQLDGVLTDVVADAQGGRSFFDGTVDEVADLDDLVADAWGDGDLGLHRGHAQVENVLEAFLGIDHDGMHDLMDQGLNLAGTAEALEKDPAALVETLTNSYVPFVEQGVENGVISTDELDEWIDLIRTEFDDRVYWDGVSAS